MFNLRAFPIFFYQAMIVLTLLVLPTILPTTATSSAQLSAGFSSSAYAAGLGDLFADTDTQQSKFLPVSQAFNVVPQVKGNQVQVVMNVTSGYYIYQDKLKLNLPDGVSASKLQFNQTAHFVDDPEFGRVAVFDQPQVVATTTLTNTTTQAIENADATLTWQGCAKAGLCYPPQKEGLTVSLPVSSSAKNSTKNTDTTLEQNKTSQNKAKNTIKSEISNKAATTPSHTATSSTPAVLQETQAANNPKLPEHKAITSDNDTNNEVNNQSKISSAIATDSQNSQMMRSDEIIISHPLSIPPVPVDVLPESPANVDNPANNEVATNTANNAASTVANGNIGLIDKDPFGLAKHPWLALLLLFLAGLGLAFTACVYPMIPIVANIVAHQHKPTAMKGFLLTTSYAMGIAVAYGTLGAIIAIFGESLGIIGWLQNPVILLSFAAVFMLLALYMLDVVTIRLPHKWSQKLHAISQAGDSRMGSITGSFIAGVLSALVVSPCVSAPLAGALVAVSTIGNPILGFAALFALGCGLSAPLIVLGATQSSFMPKAGQWMHWIKQGFALLLIAVALVLIGRVFISSIMLLVWAAWFMVVAIWVYSWLGRGKMFTQAIAILLGIWSSCLMIGAALGSQDTWQPLGILHSQRQVVPAVAPQNRTNNTGINTTISTPLPELHLTTLEQLDELISRQPKVVAEVTADWCIECRIMQKTLFANPPATLSGWQVVKLDITETSEASQAILSRYQLFGPPALLYYVDGTLVAQQVGEVKRDTFEQTLTQLNMAMSTP